MPDGIMLRPAETIRMSICAWLWLCAPIPALAQLTGDPTTYTQPDFTIPDPARAIVVTVMFNSATDVVLEEVLVSEQRSGGSSQNPPLILLEFLDQDDNIIGQQYEWHPLWSREWADDEDGSETGFIDESADGSFYFPFDERMTAVRISDAQEEMELLTVDVSTEVAEYCGQSPTPVLCMIFKDGFE